MGYKPEQFVNEVDENLICSICQEVFQDPVSCKDGHTFCRNCIKEWLKNNKICPLDNGYLDENVLGRNLAVSGIIDNLDVYCDPLSASVARFVKPCSWTGKLQDLDEHTKTCPFKQVRCRYVNCNETMQRREIKEHYKICSFKRESVDTYVWTIDDFPSQVKKYPNGSCFRSPTFWLCGYRWYLKLYPNGEDTESTGFLSLYLISSLNKEDDSQTSDDTPIVANSKTCVSTRLSVISQEPCTADVFCEDPSTVFYSKEGWGYTKFIKTSDVLSSAYCNSTNGSLTIQCTIQLVRPQ